MILQLARAHAGLVAFVGLLAAAMQWRLAAGLVLLAAGGPAAEAWTRGRETPARPRPIAPRDERRAHEMRDNAGSLKAAIIAANFDPAPDRAGDPPQPRGYRENR
jgi:hypothetical protein